MPPHLRCVALLVVGEDEPEHVLEEAQQHRLPLLRLLAVERGPGNKDGCVAKNLSFSRLQERFVDE